MDNYYILLYFYRFNQEQDRLIFWQITVGSLLGIFHLFWDLLKLPVVGIFIPDWCIELVILFSHFLKSYMINFGNQYYHIIWIISISYKHDIFDQEQFRKRVVSTTRLRGICASLQYLLLLQLMSVLELALWFQSFS